LGCNPNLHWARAKSNTLYLYHDLRHSLALALLGAALYLWGDPNLPACPGFDRLLRPGRADPAKAAYAVGRLLWGRPKPK